MGRKNKKRTPTVSVPPHSTSVCSSWLPPPPSGPPLSSLTFFGWFLFLFSSHSFPSQLPASSLPSPFSEHSLFPALPVKLSLSQVQGRASLECRDRDQQPFGAGLPQCTADNRGISESDSQMETDTGLLSMPQLPVGLRREGGWGWESWAEMSVTITAPAPYFSVQVSCYSTCEAGIFQTPQHLLFLLG